ncbi:MAG: hypothetical protein WBD31_24270 [Rubripirellula sp.]
MPKPPREFGSSANEDDVERHQAAGASKCWRQRTHSVGEEYPLQADFNRHEAD